MNHFVEALTITESSNNSNEFHPSIQKVSVEDLPPEILCQIFHLMIIWPISVMHSPKYGRRFGNRQLKLASHVCRRWREISLSDASLWAFWYHEGTLETSWSQECRKRAKDCPVSLVVWPHVDKSNYYATPGLHMLQLHQVRNLDIMICDYYDVEGAWAFLSHPLPNLKQISLRKVCLGLSNSYSYLHCLPHFRWWRTVEQLETLEMAHLAVNLEEIPLVRSLRHLMLSDIKIFAPFDIIKVLLNTPQLESLHVEEITTRSESDPDDLTCVQVQNLRSLRLSTTTSILTYLLPRIVVPNSCTINLKAEGFKSTPEEHLRFLSNYIQTSSTHFTPPDLPTLAFDFGPRTCVINATSAHIHFSTQILNFHRYRVCFSDVVQALQGCLPILSLTFSFARLDREEQILQPLLLQEITESLTLVGEGTAGVVLSAMQACSAPQRGKLLPNLRKLNLQRGDPAIVERFGEVLRDIGSGNELEICLI